MLIHIRVWDATMREWRSVDSGLVPVTIADLRRMRAAFCDRYEALLDADPINQAPQTVAREVIRAHCSHLSGFDVLSLGYAVTAPRIEVDDVRWPTDKRLRAIAIRARAM